jgi:hypothetical protein
MCKFAPRMQRMRMPGEPYTKTMKWLLFTALPLLAQPAQLSLVGTTSTQIVFSYQSPDDNACTVAAVNTDDPTVQVYDLDTTKFTDTPAVNTDFRHDWNTGTRSRVFVLGKRTSDLAADGRLYSRALETDAQHLITVTCAGTAVTLQTKTGRLPNGETFPENPPFNTAGVGNYAWPDVDWTNRSAPLIDPMTGVKVKFATFPGDFSNKAVGKFGPDYVDLSGGAWVNPQNASSGNASSLTTYSGAGSPPLFVAVDPSLTISNRLYGGWGGGEPPYSVDDFGVHVIGYGTDASSTNRTVSICLSVDSGQSCYTNSISVVLPKNTAADTGVQPSNFPSPMFGGWGKTVLRSQLPTSGTADVSGNQVVLTSFITGATLFNPQLPAGSKIRVPGSSPTCAQNLCTVASVTDGTHLKLVETLAAPLTGVNFTLANFGVRIVKTSDVGSIAVSLSYENAWSFPFSMPVGGNTEMCSHIPVQVNVTATGQPLPNGQSLTGYSCTISGSWYWISTDTGESRLISHSYPPGPSAFPGVDPKDIPYAFQPPPGVVSFDASQPNVAYTFAQLSSGARALFKLTYTGDYRALNYNYPTGNGGELPLTVNQNITWTNLTPLSQGLDLDSQIKAKFPAYNSQLIGAFSFNDFYGISGSYATFLKTIGGQDTPCWVFLLNTQTGLLDYGFNTYDGIFDPLMRWTACHSGGPGIPPSTSFLAIKALKVGASYASYGGPFVVNITQVLRQGGVLDNNTSIASDPDGSYESTCPSDLPAQYASLAGTNRCITVRVNGEACSATPSPTERANSPCPTDPTKSMLVPLAVGDTITNPDIPYLDVERYVILRKTVLAPTIIELVLLRDIRPDCSPLTVQRTNANGWRAITAPGGNTCEAGLLTLDILNHKFYQEARRLIGSHLDFGVGTAPSTYAFIGVVFDTDGKDKYAIRDNKQLQAIGQQPDTFISTGAQFGGVNGAPFNFLQSYVSKHQWTAPDPERRWVLDFRHLNGPFGIPQDSTATTLAPIVTTPVPSTSNVYQLSIIGDVNVKKIPLLGFAGRFLLKEKSSPSLGNTLTDTDAYRFCYAYKAGECRVGSTAGQAFVSVPSASITGYCQSAQYARNIPCLMTEHPLGAWAVQFDGSKQDPSGSTIRRLTMGFSGPGRQYAYGNLRALPDGKWALMSGWWVGGVRQDVLVVKLPAYTQSDGAYRQDFTPVKVDIGALSGATQAAVDFGYAEYGQPSQFFCTGRADRCTAVNSTLDLTSANPYLFVSEATQGAACASGCTIQIPALPSRVLYYQVRYMDNNGVTIQALPMQIVASPESSG